MAKKAVVKKVAGKGRATGAPLIKKAAGSAGRAAQPPVKTVAAGAAVRTALKAVAEEFRSIPLGEIVVEAQVRSAIDQEGEAFRGLMDSIAEKGVIEPIVVTPRGDQCLLLAGQRRLLACRRLGLATIPARIITDVASKEEILAIQLIENLQREEIDPIDKANGILAFFQSRHGEQLPGLDSVYSVLMTYEIDPGRVENAVAATVAAIGKITGKSVRSMRNILSLLRLAEDIQDTIKKGVIPVSQGYIFAENLDNPGLRDVLAAVVANPVTNRELIRMLKKAAGPENEGRPAAPFKAVYASLRSATRDLESGKVRYDMDTLENLLYELKSLIDLIEAAKAGGGTVAPGPVLRQTAHAAKGSTPLKPIPKGPAGRPSAAPKAPFGGTIRPRP